MSYSKSVPLSHSVDLIARKVPFKWIRLLCLILSFLGGTALAAAQTANVVTVYPTAYQTPNGSGTPIDSTSNTGGSSYLSVSNGSPSVTETCRWYGFPNVPGQIISVHLKMDWSASGSTMGPTGGGGGFSLAYTGGSGAGIGGSNFSQSSSVDVALPTGQDLTQVQVSMSFSGGAGPNTTFSGNASVSNIRIEVETVNCFANVPGDRWRGEYYINTTNLEGSPVIVRDDGAGFLNFNWGDGGPSALCGMGVDNFSARWTRTVNFGSGTHRFTVTGDDGVRLYIDGQLKIDAWVIQGATTYTADVALTAGNHEVRLEYFEYGGGAVASLSWTPVCQMTVAANRWKGEYFNNQSLQGSPSMVRDDGDGFLNLNFDAVGGSPGSACGVPPDNFSARWTRTVNLAQGIYRFTTSVDNGVRLYVDGYLRIDQWGDFPPNTYTADVFVSGGDHEIRLEFIEYTGGASVSLSWAAVSGINCYTSVSADRWKGEYYNNTDLSGSPAMVRDDGAGFLDLDFGSGSPSAGCGLGADYFSARWTRTVNFANGTYRFTTTTDDGVRLYVDGQLKIDAWVIQGYTAYTADVYLPAGDHQIKLEYFEAWGGARATLSWANLSNCIANVPADHWRGEYFNNATVSGAPSMVRDDGVDFLNFDFGLGSPGAACGIGVDNFSARWTRTVNFSAGLYRFSVTGDDGVRLYVDGQLKIDKWFPQGATTYTADVALPAGNHEIKLEYFEGGGPGVAILSWTLMRPPGCLPDTPLTGAAPQSGAGDGVAITPISDAPKRCGQKSSD